MAERIVSPGVFTRENDLSFLPEGIGEIGAAFVGPFKQGPAFVPTVVDGQADFEQKFGTPDGTYYTDYAVQNYLREAGTATIVRVLGIGGYEQVSPLVLGITPSGSSTASVISTLHATEDYMLGEETGFTNVTVSTASGSEEFLLSGDGILTDGSGSASISASLNPRNPNDVDDIYGNNPLGTKNAYVYTYFENIVESDAYLSGSVTAITDLPTQDFGYDAQFASTPWVVSQLISNQRSQLFRFHTLGDGTNENTRFKISLSGVQAAGESGATDYSVFTVTVRAFSDTDKRKTVLETFNNVNLDPASPNYIARVIGDMNRTFDEMNGKVSENGDWQNNSDYIRVEVANQGSYPVSAVPFGHEAPELPVNISGSSATFPNVVYQKDSTNNTSGNPFRYSGVDVETGVKIDNAQYLKPIPDGASTGSNTVFAFDGNIDGIGLTYEATGSATDDMINRQFTLVFQGGFDGKSPAVETSKGSSISTGNSQGFDLSSTTASGSVAYGRCFDALSNEDIYDINLLTVPGVVRRLHLSVWTEALDLVEARQDAFFIGDLTAEGDSITQVTGQANSVDSNYVGSYYPWVKTVDINTNRLVSVPPSVLMPAVYAANDNLAAEWFAPAGLTRGGIIGASSVSNRLTHEERDTLYENKVNPIATFPRQGIVAYGQKTLQDRASALDRINVRRLLIRVKKFIASTSRFLLFEQNTSQTRARFINTVNPYLEGIQQRQGLYAFKVVMDESNNTPDVIDRNILAGSIFLQPAKTVEFIVIDFNILPTGASFSS